MLDRTLVAATALLVAVSVAGGVVNAAEAAPRFPPPDFVETRHRLPDLTQPAPRSETMECVDVGVLVVALALVAWLLLYRRSRWGVGIVSAASLFYFGFIRAGCVCPIGAIQDIALGLADPAFIVPWPVIAFFAIPLLAALLFGRIFCGGVCPLGAIQDLVLLKPVGVPRWLARALGTLPYFYLGLAVLFAATNSMFAICRYDPFVSFFRLAGPLHMFLIGVGFLLLGTFVGRPYCRFLCPYGALIGFFSRVAHRNVTVTPDECVTCNLCEEACPFDCIAGPTEEAAAKREGGA